jgi:RNA polymerase sigma-70 factor (ECF subfamily)
MEPPDDELMRRVQAGEGGAEALLCRRYGPRFRMFGLRHLRDEAAAEDLAQQALLVMLQAVRERRVESLGAFVFGVCRNLAAAAKRGERRTVHAEVELPIDPPFDAVDGQRLAGCFERLPRREQKIVTMSFHEERSVDEIAAALKLTAVNARVIRHRAIARLRACLEGA